MMIPLNDQEIIRIIESKVGGKKGVIFELPNGSKQKGVLKDRVAIKDAHADYYNFIDHIQFGEEMWTRFGYYHFKDGRLVFASQTSLCAPDWAIKALFDAAREKPWFAKL